MGNRIPLLARRAPAAILLAAPAFAASLIPIADLPKPPSSFLNTSLAATPVSGRTITVSTGGDLQGAIDSAQPGDLILIQAGATFTGNFILRSKPSGGGWINIRSSAYSQLPPPGTRVSPAQASLMPKILAAGSAPAFATEPGAHRYRLTGLEITVPPDATINYSVVAYGDGTETSPSQLPSDIILDRDYIHGSAFCHCKSGVRMNGIRLSVVDSYIAQFHGIGQEAQAIASWGSPGPLKIVNNYLEGAGENILIGGAYAALPGLVQSDLEIRHNHLAKPLSWMSSVIPAPSGVSSSLAYGGSLNPGQTYYYAVGAMGPIDQFAAPGLIGALSPDQVVQPTPAGRSVTLTWNAVTYGDSTASRTPSQYVIFRTTDPPSAGANRRWVFAVFVPPSLQSSYRFTESGASLPAWTTGYLPYGYVWAVKNIFELKNAQRVWVDGNIMEGNWQNAQNGFAVLFTPRIEQGPNGALMSQNRVQDVTFSNNIVMHAGSGINVLGADNLSPQSPNPIHTRRILVRNNLFLDINGPAYNNSRGWFLLVSDGLPGGVSSLTLDHNTEFSSGAAAWISNPQGQLNMTNNIFASGDTFHADGIAVPDLVFNQDFQKVIFEHNAVLGGASNQFPAGNFFPSSIAAIGFANLAATDLRVISSSPLSRHASDGLDIGAIMQVLYPATVTTMTGQSSPAPTDFRLLTQDFPSLRPKPHHPASTPSIPQRFNAFH